MKTIKVLFFQLLLFFPIVVLAQPSNDDCATAINLGIVPNCETRVYSNVAATQSTIGDNNVPICFNGGAIDRDVWFSFSIPSDGVENFKITVTSAASEGIRLPQVALYRGDCMLNQLSDLGVCASAAQGEASIDIQAIGLTAGIQYFLRINDYSPTATPNAGNFTICIEELPPIFNMGQVAGTSLCEGVLYDSGGPDSDYGSGELETFTICPNEFNQCIQLVLETYSTEEGFDEILLFEGTGADAELLRTISGMGFSTLANASTSCVTIGFDSDFALVEEGFKLSWKCTPSACPTMEENSCDDPVIINSLPFIADNLSTCFSGNNVEAGPCVNDEFLMGEEYVFAYESAGGECIAINITGVIPEAGVSIMRGCPADNLSMPVCVGQAMETDGIISIPNLTLREAGTYYILIAQEDNCTPFNITIVPADNCPMVFPSAAQCNNALILNGCAGDLPTAISVEPAQGDPDFFRFDINNGCWDAIIETNYTWFTFKAQADGDFAFLLSNNIENEELDIDFNIWGPFENPSEACNASADSQPIRSSWADDLIYTSTGLTKVNPELGTPVTATCQGALSDGFVTPIPAKKGEVYVVLINDFDGVIFNGAVSIDFSESSKGVLDGISTDFTVTNDTSICVGTALQLTATGGSLYEWFPAEGLSCTTCPNPIATPTTTTVYTVNASSVCSTVTSKVAVEVYNVEAGADQTVCVGEVIELATSTNTDNVQFLWNTPTDNPLSCTDCATPSLTALSPGNYQYTVEMTTPICVLRDTYNLSVIEGVAFDYEVSPNQGICAGESINLGGSAVAGNTYIWTADDPLFNATESDPSVSPSKTTTYFLEVTNGSCPTPAIASVQVEVFDAPIIPSLQDTTVCQGTSLLLGNSFTESGVDYQWTNTDNSTNNTTSSLSLIAENTTTYTLTASRGTCNRTTSATITVLPVDVQFQQAADTLELCLGESLTLSPSVLPAGVIPTFQNSLGVLDTTINELVLSPTTDAIYIAATQSGDCMAFDTLTVLVDSLPMDMVIAPSDTTVCQGTQLVLQSTTYDPRFYPNLAHLWMPDAGFETPDSFYNLVLTATDSVILMRINTNGACVDTSIAPIHVNPIETIPITPADPLICVGNSLQLMADIPEGTEELMWMPEQGISCMDCANPTVTPTATTTYTLSGMLNDCPVSGMQTIEVVNGGTATINVVGESAIYQGESVNVNVAASEAIVSVEWLEDGQTLNGFGDTSLEYVPLENENLNETPRTVEISALITTVDGCTFLVSTPYLITPPIEKMPNAFTPDGDGTNDFFNLVVIGPPATVTTFQIYNRWGDQVYDNDTPTRGWDGNYQGKRQNPDVYVYVIEYEIGSRVERLSGDVMLVR